MNKIKKYFEFSNTINGTNYFLRTLLAGFLATLSGGLLGFSIANRELPMITMSILVIVPIIWFSFTTIYKRMNALHPKYATMLTFVLLGLQTCSSFFYGEEPTLTLIKFGLAGILLYLVFSNSNIENHEG
jgi:hypothetical protein